MDQMTKERLLESVLHATHEQMLIEFDRQNDTLFAMFTGARARGMSVQLHPDIYVRVAPDRKTVIGLQLEHFVSRLVPMLPSLIDVLDQADDPGLSNDEIMEIRRRFAKSDPSISFARLTDVLQHAVAD